MRSQGAPPSVTLPLPQFSLGSPTATGASPALGAETAAFLHGRGAASVNASPAVVRGGPGAETRSEASFGSPLEDNCLDLGTGTGTGNGGHINDDDINMVSFLGTAEATRQSVTHSYTMSTGGDTDNVNRNNEVHTAGAHNSKSKDGEAARAGREGEQSSSTSSRQAKP